MISIFAKHTYTLDTENNDGVYLQRVSSRVRGEEIAEYLGAKFNPVSGYEDDVCIRVKSCGLKHIRDGDYVDALDDNWLVDWLKDRPKVKVIAMSQAHYELLKKELTNDIVLIPHHHVNFERLIRDREKINTCGYVGVNSPRDRSINHKIRRELKKIDMYFVPLFNFITRQDIIDYYKTIDIQVIGYFDYLDTPFRHPTKVINAMSFGIPTVAYPIMGYKDIEDYYIKVNNMEEMINEVEKLKDKDYYNQWSNKIIKEAEKYHISEIAKKYKQL